MKGLVVILWSGLHFLVTVYFSVLVTHITCNYSVVITINYA